MESKSAWQRFRSTCKRVFSWPLLILVKFYRHCISPLTPASCRFTPTCSAYGLEAYEKRGFFAGTVLTLWRILRCSPLSPAGFDPVPLTGFKTMPLRWSKYDKYRAEQEADTVSPDSSSNAAEEAFSDGES